MNEHTTPTRDAYATPAMLLTKWIILFSLDNQRSVHSGSGSDGAAGHPFGDGKAPLHRGSLVHVSPVLRVCSNRRHWLHLWFLFKCFPVFRFCKGSGTISSSSCVQGSWIQGTVPDLRILCEASITSKEVSASLMYPEGHKARVATVPITK